MKSTTIPPRFPILIVCAVLSAIAWATYPGSVSAQSKPTFEPASDQASESLSKKSPAAQQERRQTLEEIDTSTERSRFRGAHISLSLKDADLNEVLRSFARLADVNLVIDPAVEGRVTVELHDVPWDQALYVILKSQGIAAELDGRVWRVDR